MRVGDILEIAGFTALAAAAFLALGVPVALTVAGIALLYEAQCWGAAPLPVRRKPAPDQSPRPAGPIGPLTTPVTQVNPTIQPEVAQMLARNGRRKQPVQ